MRYLGGKSRISKQIVEVILKSTKNRNRYIEPFIGSGAVLFEISKHFQETIAADIHSDLILMWKGIYDGTLQLPHKINLEEYQNLKNKPSSGVRGFVGFQASWAGKWFGGYARGEERNYLDEGARGLEKNIKLLSKNVMFKNINYKDIEIKSGDVIYCDPPYADTTEYDNVFDSNEFWKVMEEWTKIGADVFISEYKAPETWTPIWEKTKARNLKSKLINTVQITEKLYIKGRLDEAKEL